MNNFRSLHCLMSVLNFIIKTSSPSRGLYSCFCVVFIECPMWQHSCEITFEVCLVENASFFRLMLLLLG